MGEDFDIEPPAKARSFSILSNNSWDAEVGGKRFSGITAVLVTAFTLVFVGLLLLSPFIAGAAIAWALLR